MIEEGWGRVVKNDAYRADTGDKADAGKPPMDLIPWESVIGIARVFEFGAKKYAPRNWQGLSKSRLFAATIRHLVAWWMGEDNDDETGESHLYHAGCCILMLASHHGRDDRPHLLDEGPRHEAGRPVRKAAAHALYADYAGDC